MGTACSQEQPSRAAQFPGANPGCALGSAFGGYTKAAQDRGNISTVHPWCEIGSFSLVSEDTCSKRGAGAGAGAGHTDASVPFAYFFVHGF